jgi:hypothetical protein
MDGQKKSWNFASLLIDIYIDYTLILNRRNLFLILNHGSSYLFFSFFILWFFLSGHMTPTPFSSDAFFMCSVSYFLCLLLVFFFFFCVHFSPCLMEFLVAPFLFCMRPMRFLICWLLSLVTHVLSAGFLFFLTNNKYNIMSHLSYWFFSKNQRFLQPNY